MTLKIWAENRWLRTHEASPREVADLLAVIERDLGDAQVDRLSADWRLGISYNAALQLANLALAASGYRAEHERAHARAIQSLEFTVGVDATWSTRWTRCGGSEISAITIVQV